jgi:hypothetical protein
MENRPKIQQCPDVSAEERASHDLVKRVLKLRWIGMEAEAEQMLVTELRKTAPRNTWAAQSCDAY